MTFFSNVLRIGPALVNGKLQLSGTVVTLSTVEGSTPTAANPIQIRFPEGDEVIINSAASGLSINFSSATFGSYLNQEAMDLYVGIVKTNSGVSLVVGSLPLDSGEFDTSVNCTTSEHLATPTSITPVSHVLWIGKISNVSRNNGNWVTTNAKVVRWTH